MRFLPSPGWHFFLVALVAMGAFVYTNQPYISQFGYKPVNTQPADWPEMRPTPEIVAGTVFRQKIVPDKVDLRTNELGYPLCIDLQFVNYANRKNRGSFSVSLLAETTLQSRILQAQDIEDNVLQSVCFDQVPFKTVQDQSIFVEIRGIDSVPGAAVSAVFSSKPGSQPVVVDGVTAAHTLVMHLNISKDPGWYPLLSYVFLLFSSVLIAFLSLTLRFSDHAE